MGKIEFSKYLPTHHITQFLSLEIRSNPGCGDNF